MRRVILICGPPGSGKSTLARELAEARGLAVYDRDDAHWTSDRHFRAALANLGRSPVAKAVVIRAGATRAARARASALVGATDVKVLTVPADACRRRVAERGPRAKISMAAQMAAIDRWWATYQPDNGRPLALGKTYPAGDPRLKSGRRRQIRDDVGKLRIPDCMAPNCKYPGQPIDYTPQRKGQAWNPLSFELDEIVPRHLGGDPEDPTNVRPRHAGCNRAAGAKITNAIRRGRGKSRRPATASRW